MKRLRSLAFTVLFAVSIFGGFAIHQAHALTCPPGEVVKKDLEGYVFCGPPPNAPSLTTAQLRELDINILIKQAATNGITLTRSQFDKLTYTGISGGFGQAGRDLVRGLTPCASGFQRVGKECIVDPGIGGLLGNTVDPTFVAGVNAVNPGLVGATAAPKQKPANCSTLFNASIESCLTAGTVWLIKNIFLNIAGVFLWIAAKIFDISVQVSVLGFAKWAPDQLYPIWIMIRQIVSLFVVFIGLYLGFLYILGKDEKFQKYIPWVIMFALFVNFSYPIVRTAIDISNIVTLNIYSSVVGPGQSGGDIIVSRLGLKSLITSSVEDNTSPDMLKSITTVPAALLAVVYVFYASYILIMAAVLFIVRTVALVFLIVASPILLIDSIFPLLGEKAKKLREILFAQLAVAPVFMIMFALTVRFLDIFSGPANLTGTAVGTTVVGNTSALEFFNVLMMLIMLWVMLKVTKESAGAIGAYVSGAVGTVGSFAAGAATGGVLAGTGMLARKGLGGLAAKARDSGWVTKNADNFIGRRAYQLSNSVANSSFDLRNTVIAQKAAGKLGIGSSMGAGVKMGYEEESKAKLEQKKKAAVDRSRAIKTHYERDVYKENMFGKKQLDENGQAILLHRRGDENEEAAAAKRRFAANAGGGIFRTRKQNEEIGDTLMENLTADNEKIKGEIDKDSSGDVSKYSSLKTKPEKQNFVNNLEKQLTELRKTDPNGTGKQSKSVIRTLEEISKKDTEDKVLFDKQLNNVLANHATMNDRDKATYLARQSIEVQEAVRERLANGGTAGGSTSQLLTGQALRQERMQKVAEGRAENSANNIADAHEKQETSRAKAEVFSGNRAERGGATVDVDINQPSTPVDIDVTQPYQVDIDITQPYNVQQVTTQSFAEKAAATRAARLSTATQAVRNDEREFSYVKPPTSSTQTSVPPTTPKNPPLTV